MSSYSLCLGNCTVVFSFSHCLFTQREIKEDYFLNSVENVKNLKETAALLSLLVQATQQPSQGYWICCSHLYNLWTILSIGSCYLKQQETEKDKTITYWCVQRGTILWILFPADMKNRMEEKEESSSAIYHDGIKPLCSGWFVWSAFKGSVILTILWPFL